MSGRGRTTKNLIELAHKRFYGCEACSRAAGDVLEDVLNPLKLTDLERRRLYRYLTCPNCEGHLRDPFYDEVVARSAEDLRSARRWKTFSERHATQFEQFDRFIVEYPLLGGLHPFGLQLANAVKRAKVTSVERGNWYRAITDDKGCAISARTLLPADPKEIARGAGRFNSAGQLGYYVAGSPEIAAVEVLKWADRVAWLHDQHPGLTVSNIADHLCIGAEDAERYLKQRIACKDTVFIGEVRFMRPLKVLDVQIVADKCLYPILLEGLVFTGSLLQPTDSKDKSCPEYRVPQFIADLARRRRLDGIVYSSTRDLPHAFGTNLVVFNASPGLVEVVSEPVRYRWRGVRPADIMDLSHAHLEEWPRHGETDFN